MPNIVVDIWTRLHKSSMDDVDRDVQAKFKNMAQRAAENFAKEMESASPRIRKAASGILDANSRVAASNKLLADSRRRDAEVSKTVADLEQRIADRRRSGLGIGASMAKDENALAEARRDLSSASRDVIRDTDEFERAVRRQHLALKALDDARSRRGGGGGAGRSGFGGGQGGNALGGIFTSIPFVPGGKAGAVIGSGLVAVLGSVAEAAVTASQSLWLLPAAAAAGGAGFLTLKLGLEGFDKALKDMGDPKKFAQDLAGLAPNAQQAALEIQQLVGGLNGLKSITQNTLFAGVAKQLSNLGKAFMPGIHNLTTGVAGAFNDIFQRAVGQLMTPGTQGAISAMINNIVAAFRDLAPAMGPVVDAFTRIAKVGSDFLPGMATGIANLATRFADFIAKAQQSGKLQEWIQKGIDAASALGRVIGDIAHKIYDVFGNKSPQQFKDTLDGMVGAAVSVAQAIAGISQVVNGVLNALKPVATMLGGWPNLIRDVVAAWVLWKVTPLISQLGIVQRMLGNELPSAAEKGSKGIAAAFGRGGPAFLALTALMFVVDDLHNRMQKEAQQANDLRNQIQSNLHAGQSPDQATANGINQVLGPSPSLSRGQQANALAGAPPDIIRQTLGNSTPSQVAPLLGGVIPQEVWDAMKGKPGWDTSQRSFPTSPGQGPNSPAPSVPPSNGFPSQTPGSFPMTDPRSPLYGQFQGRDPWSNIPVPGVPDKKGKLPKVTTPMPPGFDAPPRPGETEGEYAAEGTLMQAQHRLEDDKATLLALKKDNNATAEQIQAQENKIVEDQRDVNKAQLELKAAQESATKKAIQGLGHMAQSLKDIGPKLDEDFGLSQGLPGLAKNLVEFVATLAAAPLLGQLEAAKQANENAYGIKGGSGLLGIMGANNLAQGKSPLLGIPGGMPGGPVSGMSGGMAAKGGDPLANLNFDALAGAEASGNWANKSNPTYRGGLQFDIPTWNAYRPPGAPDDPADASKDQQIQAAMNALRSGRKPQSLWPQNYGQLSAGAPGSGPVGQSGGAGTSSYLGGGGGGTGMFTNAGFGQGGGIMPAGMSPGMGGMNLSTIPVAAQKYANDCIDASARIILSHSGVNMTEDQLEGVIAPGGTIESQAAGMNRLDPAGRFMPMQGSGGSPAAMFNAIRASIDSGTGSILNVAPGSSIAGRPFSEGHFIAATGYNPDGTINLSDTARGTQYSVSQADAFQATRGRGIVAGTGSGPPPFGPLGMNGGIGVPTGFPGASMAGWHDGMGPMGQSGGGPSFPGPPPSPGPGGGTPGFPTPGFGPGAQGGPVGPNTDGGWQPQGGGGLGMGGLPASAAISAASAFPGGGAAAQLGIQLMNRTIQYGGELAGEAASGLMETFGLNDSALGKLGNNLPGRLLKGIMSAKPSTPTSAGQAKTPAQDGQSQKGQSAQGAQGGKDSPFQLNIENYHAPNSSSPQSHINDLGYAMQTGQLSPLSVV